MSDRLLNLVARWSARLWDHAHPKEAQRLCALLLQLELTEIRELVSERFDNKFIIIRAEPPKDWSDREKTLYKAMIAETVRRAPEDFPVAQYNIPAARQGPHDPPPVAPKDIKIHRRK